MAVYHLNSINVAGILTKDAEVDDNNSSKATMCIANNIFSTKGDDNTHTNFIFVHYYSKGVMSFAPKLKKGTYVVIESGKLTMNRVPDGKGVYVTVNTNNIQIARFPKDVEGAKKQASIPNDVAGGNPWD